MRVILAGGGTGGHVIPALAIAQELRESYGARVLFIGTARGIEKRLVPDAGFELRLVKVGALNKVSLATRVRTLFALPMAIFDAWQILGEFRPDVVIGVGGYASGPAMLAAALSDIATLAFEPNYVLGFANRVVAPLVSVAAVQFADTGRHFRRAYVTGVPVRREFFSVAQQRPAGHTRPTLLVFGGSQGARALNRALVESLGALRERMPGLLVIHQAGEKDYHALQDDYLRAGIAAELYAFIDNMPEAFARADLLVCRSGASTVAEIAAAGKPAIFVPFPHAADDHQTRNAQALAREGAALLLPESTLTPDTLVEAVAGLMNDPARLQAMAQAARRLAHPEAAAQIAALAARIGGIGSRGEQAPRGTNAASA